MKAQFLLFGSPDTYYARGGWHDFLGAFTTAELAASAGREWLSRYASAWYEETDDVMWQPLEWWQVVDLQTAEVCASSKSQPYCVREGPVEFVRVQPKDADAPTKEKSD